MRTLRRSTAGVAALLIAVAVASAVPALAQQQTTITRFSGTTTGTGTWSRTITDVTEPNGPGGGVIQVVTQVDVPYVPGLSADSVAARYRDACNFALAQPAANPNGYRAVTENSVVPSVRLSKQIGTHSFTDGGAFPIAGITTTTILPSNAEHAPGLTPAGLAALGAGLTAVVWWTRRRWSTVA
jgi:hypothetical protein